MSENVVLLMIATAAFLPWAVWTCNIIGELIYDWLDWNRYRKNREALERIIADMEKEPSSFSRQ